MSKEILCYEKGGYRMTLAPWQGGQLIRLQKGELDLLHAPDNEDALALKPTHYGLPVLFPPNRIDAGHFAAAGREYQFPLNEPQRGNSLHGFLHTRPWEVESVQDSVEAVTVVLRFTARSMADFYPYYPHCFTIRMRYTLSERGLEQEVSVHNEGSETMPVGLGFHSAFAVDAGSTVCLSAGQRVLMSERMLPTGIRPLNEKEAALRGKGLDVHAWSMDDHYTAEPLIFARGAYHGAVIARDAGRVYYEVDSFYRHWMVWNAGGDQNFICLEPQNWRVNAPNLVSDKRLSEEEAGFTLLPPAGQLKAVSRIWMEAY